MKIRFARIVAAVICGLIGLGAIGVGSGDATAARVVPRGDTTYIVFTNDETIKIAGFGVESMFDRPEVQRYWSAGPDEKTREPVYFVPGRGLVIRTSAQRLVEEAASHDGGYVVIGIHPRESTVVTLYTAW